MFTPIQLLLILFILFAISRVLLRLKEKVISNQVALFWTLVWIAALIGITLPNTTSKLASYFGVGRGVDIIVYISLALLFYLVFRIFVMIQDIRQEITHLVRIVAIQKSSKNRKKSKSK